MPPKNFSSITVPTNLYEKITKVVNNDPRFSKISEYVKFVLERDLNKLLKKINKGASS